MQPVYFDYSATTPLDAQVREAMLPFLGEIWGRRETTTTTQQQQGRGLNLFGLRIGG